MFCDCCFLFTHLCCMFIVRKQQILYYNNVTIFRNLYNSVCFQRNIVLETNKFLTKENKIKKSVFILNSIYLHGNKLVL